MTLRFLQIFIPYGDSMRYGTADYACYGHENLPLNKVLARQCLFLLPVPALAGARFRLAIQLLRVKACLVCYFLPLRLTSCLDLSNGMPVTLSLVQGVTEKRLLVTK